MVQFLTNQQSPLLLKALTPGKEYQFGIREVVINGVKSDENNEFYQATR